MNKEKCVTHSCRKCSSIRGLVCTLLLAFHKTGLLIGIFRLLTPFGSLIDTIFLLLVTLLFRLVDGVRLMFCRTVYGVQDEWCWSGIDELVLCTGWDDDKVTSLDILILTVDGGLAFSGCEGQNLVDCMHLPRVSVARVLFSNKEPTSSPMSPPTGTVMSTS